MSSKLALPNLATITEGLEQDNFLYENPFVSPVLAGDEADDESDLHRKSSFRVFTFTIFCSFFYVEDPCLAAKSEKSRILFATRISCIGS